MGSKCSTRDIVLWHYEGFMKANLSRKHDFLPWTIQKTQDNVIEIQRGEGVYFWDKSGRRYLDFISQLFNLNLGHANRRIIRAIQEQADKLCAASSALLHSGRVKLGERLAALAPGDLSKAFFTNSGSEANEIALAIARLYTGRQKVFAKYRSYHGTTLGTITLSGDPRRMSVEPGPPGAVRFFDPYCYRCDFQLEYPSCDIHCASALARQIEMEGPENVAAVIVEPFTAGAGGFPGPPGYLRRIREICDQYRVLMIADEVITGFGRTGEWFAVNHENVVPDILTVAKGITSGYVPMGAAMVREEIAAHFEDRLLPIGCTYTGHPLACGAALAALDEYSSQNAIGNSRAMGRLLKTRLSTLKEKHLCVGDVRVQGLLGCIELVQDQATREPLVPFNTSPPLVDELRQEFLKRGLYVYLRWNMVLLGPPLIIQGQDLEQGLDQVDEVLDWLDERVVKATTRS